MSRRSNARPVVPITSSRAGMSRLPSIGGGPHHRYICQFADFTVPKYRLHPGELRTRCHARPTQPICSGPVSCRDQQLRCRNAAIAEGNSDRILQWPAVHLLNVFEYEVHDGLQGGWQSDTQATAPRNRDSAPPRSAGSSARNTLAADIRETSCSAKRPPNSKLSEAARRLSLAAPPTFMCYARGGNNYAHPLGWRTE